MKNERFLPFHPTAVLLFVLACTCTPATAQQPAAPAASFNILIESYKSGLKLTCTEGCTWKELSFSLGPNKVQGINDKGMANKDNADSNESFFFTIEKAEKGLSLKGLKGTIWADLSFSKKGGQFYQRIDQNGMKPN